MGRRRKASLKEKISKHRNRACRLPETWRDRAWKRECAACVVQTVCGRGGAHRVPCRRHLPFCPHPFCEHPAFYLEPAAQ